MLIWNWKLFLFSIFFVLLFISLGFWQLNRAEQKQQLINQQTTRQQTILNLSHLNSKDPLSLAFQRVEFSGHYVNELNWLLDNQVYQGQFGYDVITLFKLNGINQWLLINRGWIKGSLNRNELPVIPQVKGIHTLQANIYIPLRKQFMLTTNSIDDKSVTWPYRIQTLDITAISAQVERKVFPYQLRLPASQPGSLQPHWQVSNMTSDQHNAYALQWFTMAFALCCLYCWFTTNKHYNKTSNG